jgi:hypothetical protein
MYNRKVVKRDYTDTAKLVTFDELPRAMDVGILQIHAQSKTSLKVQSKTSLLSKNLLTNSILLFIFAGLLSIILSKTYQTGIIVNFILEIILHAIGGVAISILIFLGLWYMVSFRAEIKWLHKMKQGRSENPYRARLVSKLGVAIDMKTFVESTIIGFIISLYYPLLAVNLSEWIGGELWLDPIRSVSQYLLSAALIGVFFGIIALFVYGYLWRYVNQNNPERHFSNIVKSLGLQSITAFLIGFIIMMADPLSNVVFADPILTLLVKLGSAAAIMLMVFALSLAVTIYAKITKSIMIPIIFCAIFVPWLLMSILPAV